MKSIAQLFFDL